MKSHCSQATFPRWIDCATVSRSVTQGNIQLKTPIEMSNKNQKTIVFLDIAMGDKKEYERRLASYTLLQDFVKEKGYLIGIDAKSTRAEDLNEEQKQLLVENLLTYSEWTSKLHQIFLVGETVIPTEIVTSKPDPIGIGRLEIELFMDKCPKTCKNFMALCTGSEGMSTLDKKKALCFKDVRFHRLVQGFMIQGGDITRGDGSGGDSIYGGKFNDEREGLKMKFETLGTKDSL